MPKIRYFAPEYIDREHIHVNGHLCSESQRQWAIRKFLKKHMAADKYSKYALNNQYKQEIPEPFVVSLAILTDGDKRRLIAIDEGNIGTGASGKVKMAQDLETFEWLPVKVMEIEVEKTKKRVKAESSKNPGANAKGAEESTKYDLEIDDSVVHENVDNVIVAGNDNLTEYDLLKQINQAKGQLERESPSGNGLQMMMAMKLAPGVPLDKLNNLSTQETLEIIIALIHAYYILIEREGILHRDIKTDNILYDRASKTLTIIDLGVAYKIPVGMSSVKTEIIGSIDWAEPEIDYQLRINYVQNLLAESLELISQIHEIENILSTLNNNNNNAQADKLSIKKVLDSYIQILNDDVKNVDKKIREFEKLLSQPIEKQIKYFRKLLLELTKDKAGNAKQISQLKELLLHSDSNPAVISEAIRSYLPVLSHQKQEYETKILGINNSLGNNLESLPKQVTEACKFLRNRAYFTIEKNVERISVYNEGIPYAGMITAAATTTKSTVLPVSKAALDQSNDPLHIAIATTIKDLRTYLSSEHESSEDALIKQISTTLELLSSALKDRTEYSAQTEVYSIGIVILNLLSKTNNPYLTQYLIDELFKEDTWRNPSSRPTLMELKTIFESLLMSTQERSVLSSEPPTVFTPLTAEEKQQYDSLTNGNTQSVTALVDCSFILSSNQTIKLTALENLIHDLSRQGIASVMLFTQDELAYPVLENIRKTIEKNGIRVHNEFIQKDFQDSDEEIYAQAKQIVSQTPDVSTSILQTERERLIKKLDTMEKELLTLETSIQSYQETLEENHNRALVLREKIITIIGKKDISDEDIAAHIKNLEDNKPAVTKRTRAISPNAMLATHFRNYKTQLASESVKEKITNAQEKLKNFPGEQLRIKRELSMLEAKIDSAKETQTQVVLYKPTQDLDLSHRPTFSIAETTTIDPNNNNLKARTTTLQSEMDIAKQMLEEELASFGVQEKGKEEIFGVREKNHPTPIALQDNSLFKSARPSNEATEIKATKLPKP